MPPKCGESPCMNGGKCSEGWNRYICDCRQTSFSGPTCGKGESYEHIPDTFWKAYDKQSSKFACIRTYAYICLAASATLRFDDGQYLSIEGLDGIEATEAEDLSLRFRTKHKDALLLATRHESSSDRLDVSLRKAICT